MYHLCMNLPLPKARFTLKLACLYFLLSSFYFPLSLLAFGNPSNRLEAKMNHLKDDPKQKELAFPDHCFSIPLNSNLLKKHSNELNSADAMCPALKCTDLQITLGSGECGATLDFLPEVLGNCTLSVDLQLLDTSLYKFGQLLKIGQHEICYIATASDGNTATCCMQVTVLPIPNPNASIVCNSDIQISLNEDCSATIGADKILTGGPYRCFDDYIVELKDWYSNNLIDRELNVPGAQIGMEDIGRQIKVTIKDPFTGNSCWGRATVEDKLAPVIICANDTCIICGTSPSSPLFMGIPFVYDNCSDYQLTFKDEMIYGSCIAGFEQKIIRTWIAIDAYNNKSSCVQTITINLVTFANVYAPHNFDDYDAAAFSCDEKRNPALDFKKHFLAYPYCVDGYLLDSLHWFNTGGFLPSPAGDLSGERLPRSLGWNCIDTGIYKGHPSPWPIYYPPHPDWNSGSQLCWGPDEVVLWLGTGYPSSKGCLNLGMTYKDEFIDLAKNGCNAGLVGCFKILRQWTVFDWCTSEIAGHNQIIKVIDRIGPQIIYPDSTLVYSDVWNCSGTWIVPKPWLADNCSLDLHYKVTIENGTVLGDEIAGYIVVGIERGIWNAFIIAEDCCGNITKKRIAVNMLDLVPPNAVCDQKTIVSLNGTQSPGENFTKIVAKDLDQNSFDNCSPHVFFKAIRMEQLRGTNNGSNAHQPDDGFNCAAINSDDNLVSNGNQIYFDDDVRFCCSDVGKQIMIVLRVFDKEPGKGPVSPSRMNPGGDLYGHFTDCMVEVEVQDKSIPTVTPPPNIVVSCSFWFDVTKLTDPQDETFGSVVNTLSARRKVITRDQLCYNYCLRNELTGYPGFIPGASPSNPPAWNKACDYYRLLFDTSHLDRSYDLVWGFDGVVLGTCGTNYSILVNDSRQCGQGFINRTIIAKGPNGISVSANQTIWVVDCDPFYINRDQDCDFTDDIFWPGNCSGDPTVIEGCGADISPDNPRLGRPYIEHNADDLCALISTEYVDEIFNIELDACFKVLRKWIVIDWCQYDPLLDPVRGRWEYLQIIKVFDKDKPNIIITIGNCEPATKDPITKVCSGHIEIKQRATDNCSPVDWLNSDYKIDLFNDGKGIHSGFDYAVGPLNSREQSSGRVPIRHHNPLADNEFNPFDASGTYPIGIHRVCWFVEDGCGNLATSCQLFEIKDCKAPTPYCHVGIITTVMPVSGCVTVWAKDLDAGSYDNCTNSENLHFYFDKDNSDSLTICCDEFISQKKNDEIVVPVLICIEDEEGNRDCCSTVVVIQDPNDICPNVGSFGKISGELKTLNGEGTEHASIQLFRSNVMEKEMTTASNGYYLFGDLDFGLSKEYVVKPRRIDEPMNGVSTADIVKIQRHILGFEKLNSPYKIIAADVNNSASITAADITEIRKLILGVQNEFANCDSWTFVPKSYKMDLNSPWLAPREILVPMVLAKDKKEDFVAIKIGDVTDDAKGHDIKSSNSRTRELFHFEINNQNIVAGDLIKIAFRSNDFKDIVGFQFTLKFNPEIFNFAGVDAGKLQLDESNFGLQQVTNGVITSSWNNRVPQSFTANEVLYYLNFRANKNTSLINALDITSDITFAEAYDTQLISRDIILVIRTENGVQNSGIFELYQNMPNPFSKETNISFRLPEAGTAKFSFYDLTGKVLKVYELQANKGFNKLKLHRSEFKSNGIIYYQLDAAGHSSTKQMLLVE
ncbi:MAG: cohesin domain-containing protein [Saprospiraceae bacterium]